MLTKCPSALVRVCPARQELQKLKEREVEAEKKRAEAEACHRPQAQSMRGRCCGSFRRRPESFGSCLTMRTRLQRRPEQCPIPQRMKTTGSQTALKRPSSASAQSLRRLMLRRLFEPAHLHTGQSCHQPEALQELLQLRQLTDVADAQQKEAHDKARMGSEVTPILESLLEGIRADASTPVEGGGASPAAPGC